MALDFDVHRRGRGNGCVGAGAHFRFVRPRALVAPAASLRAHLVVVLALRSRFLLEQRLPVRDGNLIVIRVDFGKREETMPVSAVIDEGGLKRRLHASHFRQVNVTSERFLACGFEIELVDSATSQHHNPGLFRVGRIYNHLVGHV